jgi:hypothetical protein
MERDELGSMWLRDKAAELRKMADRAEGAYQGYLKDMCLFVASRYRAAAVLLDDGATLIEDGNAYPTPPKAP